MSEFKGTSGPYHVEPFIYEGQQSSVSVHAAATAAHPVGIIIANLSHATTEHQRICFVDTPEEAMANARLLAASFDLLAEVEREYAELADYRNGWPGRNTAAGQMKLTRLRDLIVKATGKSELEVQDYYGTLVARQESEVTA